ncbi:hypothetical protein [Kitasatospora albolonga]|uniref:hypothetical protein n=2 Tax=Kitasatospora albolonga TaxID=68173 RepID=UPI0035E98ED1
MTASAPSLSTPLGPFGFSAAVGHRRLPDVPDECRKLPGGGLVLRWNDRAAEVELLLTRFEPDPDLVDVLPVDVCQGALWRVTAHRSLPRFGLTTAFAELPAGAEGFPSTSQAVAAIEIHAPGLAMTLAAPDEEDLCLRAFPPRRGVPAAWAGLIDDVYARRHRWGVEYLPGGLGLDWVLPELPKGESFLLETNLCWRATSPEEDRDDMSTWWAAITRPEHLLAAAGGNPFGAARAV